MCGRFTLFAEWARLLAHFGITEAPAWQWQARYNIAPTQQVPVVLHSGQARCLRLMNWGMPAHTLGARPLINARGETVASKPAFRDAFASRRCLVPASGFYEWRQTAAGKQPMFIHPPEQTPLAFAAIWQESGRQEPESVAIITSEANATVRPIHDRMPVILPPQHYQNWLAAPAPEELLAMLKPYEGQLAAHPVADAVNTTQHDHPDLILPVPQARHGQQMELW